MTAETSRRWHVTLLVIAAIALTHSFLLGGMIPGHDRREHLEYQHFFNEQIAHGELYPRWLSGMNMGRGAPTFFVQYPLPYYIAWVLGCMVPNHWGVYAETRSQGLSMVLAAIVGALSIYLWASTFADSQSSMVASLVFLTLPYFLSIDLYLRNAIGETWALVLMPLTFYFVQRGPDLGRRALAGLAAAFGLILLSHILTAVLLAPVLFVYAGWRSEPNRRWSGILHTAGALVLGVGLAGIYIFPLLAHLKYFHSQNFFTFLGANYFPLSQMFAYDYSMYPRDTRAWYWLSSFARLLAAGTIVFVTHTCYRLRTVAGARLRNLMAGLAIAILALTIFAGRIPGVHGIEDAPPLGSDLVHQRAHIFLATFLTLLAALLCYWFAQGQKNGGLANVLLGLAIVSYLMTTRWSLVIWKLFSPLWDIQFPWRFNVFIAVATSGLTALAVTRLRNLPARKRITGTVLGFVVWMLIAGGIAAAGYKKDTLWTTHPVAYEPYRDEELPLYAEVRDMQEALDAIPYVEGVNAKPNVVLTSGTGRATLKFVQARRIELYASCETDCTMKIGQFYYPAWRARREDGTGIPLRAASPGGLMEILLPPGESRVLVDLPRGRMEQIGPFASFLSLCFIVTMAVQAFQGKQ